MLPAQLWRPAGTEQWSPGCSPLLLSLCLPLGNSQESPKPLPCGWVGDKERVDVLAGSSFGGLAIWVCLELRGFGDAGLSVLTQGAGCPHCLFLTLLWMRCAGRVPFECLWFQPWPEALVLGSAGWVPVFLCPPT